MYNASMHDIADRMAELIGITVECANTEFNVFAENEVAEATMFNHKISNKMSYLIVLVLILAIAYIAINHRPKHPSVAELSEWFSVKLDEIAKNAATDIALEKQGHYRHKGMQTFASVGKITYELIDKNYSRFELSELHAFDLQNIESTEGYQRLRTWAQEAGVSLELNEVITEGDGISSWDEVDEYIDDVPRYYTVTLSGW